LRTASIIALAAAALAACSQNPLKIKRSTCPAVAVATYTGDITLFKPGTEANAANIDVVASMTNVRQVCSESPEKLIADLTFDVQARRTSTAGARTVVLPIFVAMVQGGNLVVSKQLSTTTVNFADGQDRAIGKGGARGSVARSAVALPDDIQKKINRKRKAGDLDAATDPLADPLVKAAMRAASFEVIIGFSLDDRQLGYNVTK
jgi:hypothetical protein